METFLSFTVIGIVAGAIYAVTAMGLVVTYTTTGVFNFAQGAVGMVAAFSYWELTQSYHWPVVLALVVVLLVEAPLLGALVEFIFMRRIYGASADRSLMVTLGVLLIMVGVATAVWGQQTLRIVPPFFEGHEVTIFGVVVTYQQLLIVIVAVVIALGLRLYFMNFRSGVAMRAVVDDPELLALAGVAPYRVSRRGWMLGFMLAGLAGVLLAPTVGSTGLNIDTLTLLVVNGYAAAVVGRLRSLPWTFVGGIALGLADAYATGYLPGHIPAALVEQIATIIPAVFLFVALLVVPSARLRAIGRIPVHLPPKVANARQSLVGSGLLVVAVAVISVVAAGSTLATISQGIALGIVALSLVLLTGYGGQVSLCQYTFLGVGAFTMGKVAGGGGSWLGLLAAVGICAALGMLVALPALRLRGLYLALATLAFERGVGLLGHQLSFRRELDRLLEVARENGSSADPVIRQRLARSYAELEILRYNTLRSLSGYDGPLAPPEASISKLYWATWHRQLGELALDICGPAGLVAEAFPYELDELQRTFLFSRSETIYGGSNEIQKNIIGERVLGLPPEPKGSDR